MHLVQIILPLYANDGARLPQALFERLKQELAQRFGGVTAFTRSPAQGLWDDGERVQKDDVLLYEVMAETLERDWWKQYRRELEQAFHQQEVLIRAHAVERL